MEISQELKDRILAEVEKYRPHLLAIIPTIKSERAYVKWPILIDGIMDFIRFNVSEKRFDQIEICMAKDGITLAEWLGDWKAYCDNTEIVTIELPPDYCLPPATEK